jgi:hypothetical protein
VRMCVQAPVHMVQAWAQARVQAHVLVLAMLAHVCVCACT